VLATLRWAFAACHRDVKAPAENTTDNDKLGNERDPVASRPVPTIVPDGLTTQPSLLSAAPDGCQNALSREQSARWPRPQR